MAKKLDEATRLLIDSLPESLKELALSASEIGYLSQMDLDNAFQSDEVPDEEQDEVVDFFKQDLGLEVIETDSDRFTRDMEKYYEEDEDGIFEGAPEGWKEMFMETMFPSAETLNRCGVMKDFGSRNSEVVKMWGNIVA